MSMEVFTEGGRKEIPLFGADQQIQAVRFMFGSTMVELKPSHGADGSTSLDVLLRQTHVPVPPASAAPTSGLAAVDVNAYPSSTQISDVRDNPGRALLRGHVGNNGPEIKLSTPSLSTEEKRAKEMRGWIMLVATLFAGMTFQAGITMPGGYWQDDSDSGNTYPALAKFTSNNNMTSTAANTSFAIISLSPSLSLVVLSSSSNLSNFNATMTPFGPPKNESGHSAGDPVWKDKHQNRYKWFYWINTLAFVYSMLIIFALLNEEIYDTVFSRIDLRIFAVANIFCVYLSYTFGTGGEFLSPAITVAIFVSYYGMHLVRYFKFKRQTDRTSMENPVPPPS